MVNCWNNSRCIEKMSKTKHYKYPYEKLDIKHEQEQYFISKCLAEKRKMEKKQCTVSASILGFFAPLPEDEIYTFTITFHPGVPKHLLYQKIADAFADCWDGEPVSVVQVRLSKALQLKEIRQRVNKVFNMESSTK